MTKKTNFFILLIVFSFVNLVGHSQTIHKHALVRILTIPKGPQNGFRYRYSPEPAAGFGTLISREGLILTTSALIDRDADIEVTLDSGHKYRAKIIGVDRLSGVGLLKIDSHGEKNAYIPVSKKSVMPGDLLHISFLNNATGEITVNPVTATAINLTGIGITPVEQHLVCETATTLNLEGMPLIDRNNEIAGLILAPDQNSTKKLFAMPAHIINHSLQALLKGTKPFYPFLGLHTIAITPETRSIYGTQEPEGLLILGTVINSPAGKKGLGFPDVITGINGKPIRTRDELASLLYENMSLDGIQITIKRFERTLSTTIRPATRALRNTYTPKDFARIFCDLEIYIEDRDPLHHTYRVKELYSNSLMGKIKKEDFIHYIESLPSQGAREYIRNDRQLEFILNNAYLDDRIVAFDLYFSANPFTPLSLEEILEGKKNRERFRVVGFLVNTYTKLLL